MATPQSGSVSAIGMCIESTGKTIPITGGSNPRTVGATNNPHRFFNVNGGGGIILNAHTLAPNEIDGNIERTRHFLTGLGYAGEFSGFLDVEEIHYLLMGIFGSDVQTTAQAADSTHSVAYKHVFKPKLKCPTFTVEEIFGDATYGRLTSGVVVESLNINWGDMLTWRAGLAGMRQIPNTFLSGGTETEYDFGSTAPVIPTDMGGDGTKTVIRTASPSYVTVASGNHGNGALAFAGLKYGAETGFSAAYLKIDGSTFTTTDFLPNGNVNITRGIQMSQVGGSGRNPDALCSTGVNITGSFNMTFQDNTITKALAAHKKLALNLKWEGSQIGSSDVNHALELHLPNVRLNRAPLSAGTDCITVSVDFDGIYDSSFEYGAKISTWNAFDTSSLNGNTGSYSGNMGGYATS